MRETLPHAAQRRRTAPAFAFVLVKFVGHTMIDSLGTHEPAARRLNVTTELQVEDYVLVTLHRPGLVDHPDRFEPVLEDTGRDRREPSGRLSHSPAEPPAAGGGGLES